MVLGTVWRAVVPPIAMLAVLGLLAACGSGDDEASGAGLPQLVATTTIWADVTSQVACGEPVESIVPAGADPHSFEPSLRDREQLSDVGAVIANGAGLEEALADLVDSAAGEGVPVVRIADHVDVVDGDPHVWQDPRRVLAAVDAIETAVVGAGRDAATIGACADAYRAELTALDADITAILAPVPPERRVLVTNHDAFGYFAERFGFDVVGTVIPSSSTLGEGSAGQLAALADTIERYDVPVIFAERLGSADEAQALAKRLGVAVVELESDALASDGTATTYTGMMRANAETIAAALG
ncbi:MAG TPA: metal ABC transporter substrate-binding protein [Ilumatobacter sp.]|jgi:zinc/manganese transport system substrate-binding protein|nr:metal ABC transporter substrate-binding protein [Ilumatobacter sp.]